MLAEIDLAHSLVLDDLARLAAGQHASLADDVGAVADAERLAHVVVARLVEMLERHDLPALDLTDDELAKSHVRYMVGGRAPQAENEVVYRFVFPERPGALMNFLSNLRSDWNISLFHYRNHGSDFGRVLVGMQVPPADKDAFDAFLQRLGYDYVAETGNPAYRLFLSGS